MLFGCNKNNSSKAWTKTQKNWMIWGVRAKHSCKFERARPLELRVSTKLAERYILKHPARLPGTDPSLADQAIVAHRTLGWLWLWHSWSMRQFVKWYAWDECGICALPHSIAEKQAGKGFAGPWFCDRDGGRERLLAPLSWIATTFPVLKKASPQISNLDHFRPYFHWRSWPFMTRWKPTLGDDAAAVAASNAD